MKTVFKIAAIVVSVFFVSCSDEDKIWVTTELPPDTDLSLLDIWSYEVPFEVQSNGEWEIVTEGDWFYVFPKSGSGNATVQICVLENDTKERQTGTILFSTTNSSAVQTIEIGQKCISDYALGSMSDDFNQKKYAVGYGYDTRKDYASPASVTRQIVRWKEMDSEDLIAMNASNSSFYEKIVTGSSLEELAQNLSGNVNFKGKYCGFRSEVNTTFKERVTDNGYNEYAIAYIEYKVTDIVLDTDIKDIKEKWLTDAARKAINGVGNSYRGKEGIDSLFNNYGTHLITKADLGGRLKYNLTVDVSKVTGYYDIAAFMKASYSNAFVSSETSVDAELKKSYEKNQSSVALSFDASGGDSSPLTKYSDKAAIDKWKGSVATGYDNVKTNNTALVGFGRDLEGIIPIYELADDPARKEEIKAVMDNKSFVTVEYEDKNNYHLEVPSFSDSLSTTLVKEVKDSSDRVVAVVCNEFIPEISPTKRVDVVYPVASGKILMHAGFFTGYKGRRPARISWNGSNLKIVDYDTLQETRYTKLYLSGASVKTQTEEESKQTSCHDAYLKALNYYHKGGDYNYPLVKIFGNIWTREDYKSGHSAVGGEYRPFILDNHPQSYTIKHYNIDFICAYLPDIMLFNRMVVLMKYKKDYNLEPSGWEVPSSSHYIEIDAMLKKYNLHTGKSFRYNSDRPQTLGYDATSSYLKAIDYKDNTLTGVVKHVDGSVENSYWTNDAGYVRMNDVGFYVIEPKDNKGLALYDFLPVRLIKKN